MRALRLVKNFDEVIVVCCFEYFYYIMCSKFRVIR